MKDNLSNMIKETKTHRSCHLINHRLDYERIEWKCMNNCKNESNSIYNGTNESMKYLKDHNFEVSFQNKSNDNFRDCFRVSLNSCSKNNSNFNPKNSSNFSPKNSSNVSLKNNLNVSFENSSNDKLEEILKDNLKDNRANVSKIATILSDSYVNYNHKNNNQINPNNHQSKLTYINYNSPTMSRSTSISSFQSLTLFIFCLTFSLITAQTVTSFEKLTNRDYSGFTYYTIRNVSLYECLGKLIRCI